MLFSESLCLCGEPFGLALMHTILFIPKMDAP
jgi:hypothetical protein